MWSHHMLVTPSAGGSTGLLEGLLDSFTFVCNLPIESGWSIVPFIQMRNLGASAHAAELWLGTESRSSNPKCPHCKSLIVKSFVRAVSSVVWYCFWI